MARSRSPLNRTTASRSRSPPKKAKGSAKYPVEAKGYAKCPLETRKKSHGGQELPKISWFLFFIITPSIILALTLMRWRATSRDKPSISVLREPMEELTALPKAISSSVPRRVDTTRKERNLSSTLHPKYEMLIKEYPFQPVRNDEGRFVNIILVRSPFRSQHQHDLFQQYKGDILFLGISSFEDFPLPPSNPYSGKFPADLYVGMFPGFLYMFRDKNIFPKHVKLLLMSQSDFALPDEAPAHPSQPKKWDFTFSGSDQDVENDCDGWSSYAKNWTLVKDALKVMCGEFNMTGVLVATMAKQGSKACSIPEVCKEKIKQTRFLPQDKYFAYLKRSRFSFIPQVHDASPRVTTQSLALDIPMLMNRNIVGGWKYLNEKTGEFFNDMSDFRESLRRIMDYQGAGHYKPRDYVLNNFGDRVAGPRLKQFVEINFQHRVKLPEGTRWLLPSGA